MKAKTTGDLLAMIPDLASQLPKSLQDRTSSTSKSLAHSRAMGDVVTLDPASIDGVRAEGYVDLKQSLANNMATSTLKVFKTAVTGKDIPLNQDYKFGLVTMPEGTSGPDGSPTMDLGVVRLSRPQADTLQALWSLSLSGTMAEAYGGGTYSLNYRFAITIVGTDGATVKAKIAVSATQTMGEGDSARTYKLQEASSYDAATGTTVQVIRPESTGGGSYTSLSTKDGFASYYQVSEGSRYVAYASDTMGGVARSSSRSSGTTTTNSISTEFYDGNGDLIEQQWGDNSPVNTGWRPVTVTNVKDLVADKPTTFQVKRTTKWIDSTPETTKTYSIDGTNWQPLDDASSENYVWKAGSSWAGGDSVYYYQASTWEPVTADGVTTYVSTTTYKVGYTVPAAQRYLGTDYYLQNTFPLKALTLAPQLKNYLIKRKEGTTVYWVYPSGSPVTEAEYNAASPNNRSKSTWYSYWFENRATNDANQAADEYNPEQGDLWAGSLSDQNFYYWDPTALAEVKTSTTVVYTTETVPVGFAFGHQGLVDAVKTQLETLYQTIPTDLLDSTKLNAQADAILVMPSANQFPVVD